MWARTKNAAKVTFEIFKSAGRQYGIDRVNRMAAAVAYRTMFALAPLLLVAIWVVSLFLGDVEARGEITDAVGRVAGTTVETALDNFLRSIGESSGAVGLIGIGLLLWTSSSLFMELQNNLNDIFNVPYEQTTGVMGFLIKRGLGFLWALSLGLMLVAIWLLNSLWQFVDEFLPPAFAPVHDVISYVAPAASLLILPFLFALIFQSLTRVKVRWRAIWWGSVFTAAAFLLATYGTGLYFLLSDTSAATIAGSIFVVLLLAYVLSAVFLFGAEVTKVYDSYLDGVSLQFLDRDDQPEAIVDRPEPSLPLAAILAFLGGLFVGWRRKS
ncbi:MAG TPA: YihY/virulence factor BrkB family protein [Acidimicrobiia bacterium]